jgi:hypothetical protein
VTGETITLKFPGTDCGSPVTWDITGHLSRRVQENETSFTAHRWVESLNIAPVVVPKTYTVAASTRCGKRTNNFIIRCWPSNKYKIDVTPLNRDFPIYEFLLKFLRNTFAVEIAPEAKFKISAEAGFEEDDKSFRVYWNWSVKLVAEISLQVRIPFGPLQFIPAWMKKYGDLKFFIDFIGKLSVQGGIKKSEGELRTSIGATGEIYGKVGINLFVVSSKILEAEASGGTGIVGEAEGAESNGRPAVELKAYITPLKFELMIKSASGWVEFSREVEITDRIEMGKTVWRLPIR